MEHSFPGDTTETISQVRNGESMKRFVVVDEGIGAHDPKTHGPSTSPFIWQGISGVFVRLTSCEIITNSLLPKLKAF